MPHVDLIADWIDIHEDRGRANGYYCPCGGEEGVGRDDDLIACSDIQGTQCQDQSIGPGCQTDCMLYAEIACDAFFEPGDGRTEDEVTRLQRCVYGCVDLFFDG